MTVKVEMISRPDDLIKDLKKKAWRAIIEKTNLRKVMCQSDLAEIDRQIETGQMPDITESNVLATLETTYKKMPAFAEALVLEVYESLRPQGWQAGAYKTNQKSVLAGVGEKVVLGWWIERQSYAPGGKPWRVRYGSQDRCMALDNVFHLLNGKGVVKTHYGPLYDAIAAADKSGKFETEYFRGRCYKNNNLHLEFKRSDLLAKFNQVAGGARLTNR